MFGVAAVGVALSWCALHSRHGGPHRGCRNRLQRRWLLAVAVVAAADEIGRKEQAAGHGGPRRGCWAWRPSPWLAESAPRAQDVGRSSVGHKCEYKSRFPIRLVLKKEMLTEVCCRCNCIDMIKWIEVVQYTNQYIGITNWFR
jgi:hypothetical protein